jgi:hypothetical protein
VTSAAALPRQRERRQGRHARRFEALPRSLYYSADYSKERLEAWLTYGPPRDCIAHLQRYAACGCRRITFRISTMGDPMAQLRRLVEEVLPYV